MVDQTGWIFKALGDLHRENPDLSRRTMMSLGQHSLQVYNGLADDAEEAGNDLLAMYLRHFAIQFGVYYTPTDVEPLVSAALVGMARSEQVTLEEYPYKFCAHDDLLQVLLRFDPVGYSGEIESIAREKLEVVPGDLQCSSCFSGLLTDILIREGRYGEAAELISQRLKVEEDEGSHHRIGLLLSLGEIAFFEQDGPELSRLIEQVTEEIEGSHSSHESHLSDLRARELELLILMSKLDEAKGHLREKCEEVKDPSGLRAEMIMNLATAFEQAGRWQECLAEASAGYQMADRLGMLRLSFDGRKLAAKAIEELHNSGQEQRMMDVELEGEISDLVAKLAALEPVATQLARIRDQVPPVRKMASEREPDPDPEPEPEPESEPTLREIIQVRTGTRQTVRVKKKVARRKGREIEEPEEKHTLSARRFGDTPAVQFTCIYCGEAFEIHNMFLPGSHPCPHCKKGIDLPAF
jgi:hypothetical protein